MNQEKYLKERMDKAATIADELGFIIEHTLGVQSKELPGVPNVLDFRKNHEDYFQGRKLYKLMKDFMDLSTKADENGNYPEEIINKYLDDMAEFSFNPKYESDVFEFTIQDYVYRIEVVMESIVGMTLLINDEWIQSRVIQNINDFSAVMRIMDIMKGMYENNPYVEEDEFVKFYNLVVKIADGTAPGWQDVEKKIFVPYSTMNDIYISPYNSEQFMLDFIKELENSKSRLSKIVDLEERKEVEAYIDFIGKCNDNFRISGLTDLYKFIDIFKGDKEGNGKIFSSNFFQDILKNMSKKHNVINRLKELKEELKTFSDVKSVEEQCKEAEKEYGYEAVKQYLIDKNKSIFLEKAVLMTPIDSVNIVNFIAFQPDKFISDRADIFIELTMRFVIPLQEEHYNRIWSILASDPVNLFRKVDPVLAESIFGDKEYGYVEPDLNLFKEVTETIEKVAQAEEKYKEEKTDIFKLISKEVFNEMDELEKQGKIVKKLPTEFGEIPEYFQVAVDKAVEKFAGTGLIEKIIAEATKK